MRKWILLFTLPWLMGAHAPWEEVDDDDGIKVWAREVPGSDIREVKAEAEVSVPAEQVWQVLLDSTKYTEFMPYLEEIRTVGRHKKGIFEYQRIDPPLVDDRDYTMKITLEIDDENKVYRRVWAVANDKGPPPKQDTVRVTINHGSWTVTEAAPGRARIAYYLYTHPGGSIPNWMVNRGNTISVPTLLDAVRQRSLDPTWTP